MIRIIKKGIIAVFLFAGAFGISGCSRKSSVSEQELPLVYEDKVKRKYAENFSIDYYAGGYFMISLRQSGTAGTAF